MRVAIIGGGIAGLAAAYELELARRAGADLEYRLFEASERLGGVVSSSIVDGSVLEHGPDSFLTEKQAAAQLCRELGLGDDLVGSNDGQRQTLILVGRKLISLPDGLMFLAPTKLMATAMSPLFSVGTKLRMGLDLFRRARRRGKDESVAALVRRHFGQEAVDRLADPLLTGIYGGTAEQLSVQAVLPRFVEMEAKFGSLTRGVMAGRKRSKGGNGMPAKPIFTTLRGGLQQMVDALVDRLEPEWVHLASPVKAVDKDEDGWAVRVDGEIKRFDGVIMATPAWVAAGLLREVDAGLSDELGAIPYTSSITMNLIFDEGTIGALPKGFGFLVPAVEKRPMLAATFVHRKFVGRTAAGKAVLRVFLGGAHNEGLLDEREENLIAGVREELREILGITTAPEFVELHRWRRAMAQYSVGHLERQKRIQARLREMPELRLAGNAYDGIGVSDCVRLGREAAKDFVAMHRASQAIAQSRK